MAHEFVGWLVFPEGFHRQGHNFKEYLESEIIHPLTQAGYVIECDYPGILWSLKKDGIEISLEYNPNGGDFSVTVDKRTNATKVYQDFVTHTILRELKPYE